MLRALFLKIQRSRSVDVRPDGGIELHPAIVATNRHSVFQEYGVEMAQNTQGSHSDLFGSYWPFSVVAAEHGLGSHESLNVWFTARLFTSPPLRHSHVPDLHVLLELVKVPWSAYKVVRCLLRHI